jgi:hypothetical protein
MYDPSVGRWLEEDPIGFDAGQSNLSQFVGNDPVNGSDPSGQYLIAPDQATATKWVDKLSKSFGIKARPIELDGGRSFLYIPSSERSKLQPSSKDPWTFQVSRAAMSLDYNLMVGSNEYGVSYTKDTVQLHSIPGDAQFADLSLTDMANIAAFSSAQPVQTMEDVRDQMLNALVLRGKALGFSDELKSTVQTVESTSADELSQYLLINGQLVKRSERAAQVNQAVKEAVERLTSAARRQSMLMPLEPQPLTHSPESIEQAMVYAFRLANSKDFPLVSAPNMGNEFADIQKHLDTEAWRADNRRLLNGLGTASVQGLQATGELLAAGGLAMIPDCTASKVGVVVCVAAASDDAAAMVQTIVNLSQGGGPAQSLRVYYARQAAGPLGPTGQTIAGGLADIAPAMVGAYGYSSAMSGPASTGSKAIYSTQGDIHQIINSGRVWGQTEGSVYGMTYPNASRLRSWAKSPLELNDPGVVVFEGEAAKLFKSHPFWGPWSGSKKLLGQQKAGFGDIVFLEPPTVSTLPNGQLQVLVRSAELGPHMGQSNAVALSRLWGSRIGLDGGITGGGATVIYVTYKAYADK